MKRMSIAWAILWICSLSVTSAAAAPLDSYFKAAEKEGEVRLGITLRERSYGKPAGERYLDAFRKKYSFLKVHFKRIGGSRERERVFSEMTGGIFNFDVVTSSETMIEDALKVNLPKIIDWKALGVPEELIHPKNAGISLRTPVYGIAYNREHVSDKEAQTFTWETCTDPKWRGKSAMDDRPRHLNVLYQDNGWGAKKTLDYAKRWADNKPVMEASRSTAAQKLAVGAFHMICGMPRNQVRALNVYGGTDSIGIVFPEPVPVGIGDVIYVPQKAKNSNAGVLFLMWTTTQEAQNLLDDVDFNGHPSYEGNEVNRVVRGKKVVYGSWDYTMRSDDILAELLTAMGFPVVR